MERAQATNEAPGGEPILPRALVVTTGQNYPLPISARVDEANRIIVPVPLSGNLFALGTEPTQLTAQSATLLKENRELKQKIAELLKDKQHLQNSNAMLSDVYGDMQRNINDLREADQRRNAEFEYVSRMIRNSMDLMEIHSRQILGLEVMLRKEMDSGEITINSDTNVTPPLINGSSPSGNIIHPIFPQGLSPMAPVLPMDFGTNNPMPSTAPVAFNPMANELSVTAPAVPSYLIIGAFNNTDATDKQ